MCGIVGYAGPKAAADVVIEGLRRLEYRGYDSAGVAIVSEGRLHVAKKAGKLVNLERVLSAAPLPRTGLGIGHTRWATHGAPNDVNAHPHTSYDGRIAVIHNGIIENFAALRQELHEAGIVMTSQTDTEVVAHLLAGRVAAGERLDAAMRTVGQQLQGAFTLVAVDAEDPEVVVAARRNSPLVVGVGDGENFVASDVAAFIEHTREAIELGQDQVVRITRDAVVVTTFDGAPAEVRPYHVDWDLS
ncbi:MAG TPA: glutamine--fructose-6-phosphate aminotransferase, partial [Propionibacteriaceae bacterium]|nr:glutamine--fructose-6-phosphate aminotransferase [Propionibacteriaceae bacterium]